MYKELLRNIDLDLKPLHILGRFEYEDKNYVRLSTSGVDYFRKIINENTDGDLRYLIIYEN